MTLWKRCPRLIPNKTQLFFLAAILVPAHLLLAILGRRLPYGSYYVNDEAYLLRQASERREASLKALDDMRYYMQRNRIDGPLFDRSTARTVCVGIVSVKRHNSLYLTQTVAALLSRIPWRLQDRVRVTILNANLPPEEHQEAIKLSDLVRVRNQQYPKHPNPNRYKNMTVFVKENLDYELLLREIYSQQCEYGLLLEDDAFAAPHWAEDLLKVLKEEMPKHQNHWLFLKLFSPLQFCGWDKKEPKDYILVPIITILFSLILLSITSFALTAWSFLGDLWVENVSFKKRRSNSMSYLIDLLRPNFLALATLLGGVGLFVIYVGKLNILWVGDGIHDLPIGMSAVAILYPRHSLLLFADYMAKTFASYEARRNLYYIPNKDLHTSNLISEQEAIHGWRYEELLIHPNLFQHIGIRTSLAKLSSARTAAISHHFPDHVPLVFEPTFIEKDVVA